jgi:hypothetical protein
VLGDLGAAKPEGAAGQESLAPEEVLLEFGEFETFGRGELAVEGALPEPALMSFDARANVRPRFGGAVRAMSTVGAAGDDLSSD